MQQRLGIAQALIGSPRLLLLDEPTSALDPGGRRIVRGLLEEVRSRGIAVLLNSHLLSEVERVCDSVTIIARGGVVAAGLRRRSSAAGSGVEIDTDRGLERFEGVGREGDPEAGRRAGRRRPPRLRRSARSGPTLEDAYLEAVGGRAGERRDRGGCGRRAMAAIIVGHALREAVRRRVLLVVARR